MTSSVIFAGKHQQIWSSVGLQRFRVSAGLWGCRSSSAAFRGRAWGSWNPHKSRLGIGLPLAAHVRSQCMGWFGRGQHAGSGVELARSLPFSICDDATAGFLRLWNRWNCHRRTVQVTLHFFAIRIEERRVVAAEIEPSAAAALLDAAHPLLLGTGEDLAKVAQRFRRPLVTIARAAPRRSSAAASAVPNTLRPRSLAPAPVAVAGLRQPAARGLFGMA